MSITIKKGSLLTLVCVRRDENGNPVPLTNVTVKASLADSSNNTVATFNVDKKPETGVFHLTLNTQPLKNGNYHGDIKYTVNGNNVDYTSDFVVNVIPSITK